MGIGGKRVFLYVLLLISGPGFSHASAQVSSVPHHAETRELKSAWSGPFGHNLSQTSVLLPAKSCTVGIQILACGISNRFSVGTSPWLLTDYSMPNVYLRFGLAESESSRLAYQFSYFKAERRNEYIGYDMEAVWNGFVYSSRIAPAAIAHLNFQVNYYANEVRPFSLRRRSTVNSPWQLNASMLLQADLGAGFFLLGELALLDFARPPFRFHSGASIGRRSGNWEWHGGYSITAAPRAWFSPVRVDLGYFPTDQQVTIDQLQADFSMHPEFSVQYFF